jgi:predicted nucleic acid-binding protein
MGNPDAERRVAIGVWKLLAQVDVETSSEVERVAVELRTAGLKPLDALHVASAMEANADCFITTDKGILKKMKSESRIKVLDPLDFLRQMDGEDYENRQ